MATETRGLAGTRVPLEDDKIVSLYFERDERAIDETDYKYKKLLWRLIANILDSHLDCEECLSDTYIGAWNAMPPTRPRVLGAFLSTIARRVAIKRYHTITKKSVVNSEMTVALSEIEDFVADEHGVERELESEYLGRIITQFVRALNERQRYIFMSRFFYAEKIATIAKEIGVSVSTVNKELENIKNKLKEKLEGEGYVI
jgi:RNA polymerase sigma-70 factor (ECF subfamily)